MARIHFERLKKLADHLMHGQLGHERFDFTCYNRFSAPLGMPDGNECGTAGCALGECPIVFPDDWIFRNGLVVPRKYYGSGIWASCSFFGIWIGEANHLFMPTDQAPEIYGGISLDKNATRYDVATNIYDFIRVRERDFGINESILTGDEPSFYVPETNQA